MKEQMIIVSNKLIVKIATNKKRTVISVYEEGVKTVLSDIETGAYFWSKVVYNDYYIVAYSRGCMVNQIPLSIDAVYSINDRTLLDLSNKKLKVMFEYMLLCKKAFDLTHVLAAINNTDIGLNDKADSNYLINYLTAGNQNITRESVLWYILKQYPLLGNYTNMTEPLSVVRYKEIAKKLRTETCYFHIMPQELHKLPSIFGSDSNEEATDYMQIYISEAEHSEQNNK